MRISCDKKDPGYCRVTTDVKIFLNKQEVEHVVTTDEELGIVVVRLRNNGKYVLSRDKTHAKTITLKGEVDIYLGPRTKKYLKWRKDNNLDNFGGKR